MNTSELKCFIRNNLGHADFYDEVFRCELLSVVIKLFNIEEYLSDIIISDLSKYEAVGLYKKRLKVILLDLKDNINYIEYLNRKYKTTVSANMIEYYNYLNILHECVHAYQIKYIDNISIGLHRKLLLDSMSVGSGDIKLNGKEDVISRSKASKLYNSYHSFFPIEREAIAVSNIILKDVFSLVDTTVSPFIKREYLTEIFSGYIKDRELTSPTKEFYSIIKRDDIFSEMDYNNIDFIKRLSLGLPISTEEFYSHVVENNECLGNKLMSIRVLKNGVKFY